MFDEDESESEILREHSAHRYLLSPSMATAASVVQTDDFARPILPPAPLFRLKLLSARNSFARALESVISLGDSLLRIIGSPDTSHGEYLLVLENLDDVVVVLGGRGRRA